VKAWEIIAEQNSAKPVGVGAASQRLNLAGDGKRYVVRADAKLTAFVELESAIRPCCELS